MNSTVILSLGTAAYVILFLAIVISVMLIQKSRRKERPPDAFKLLRAPGESLRVRVNKFEGDFLLWVLGAALAPLIIVGALAGFLGILDKDLVALELMAMAIVAIGGIVLGGVLLYRKLTRWRNDNLGYLGERAVAEQLEELKAQGYRVFHDVPASSNARKFNLDHVTVGPTGVSAIETKTRRKRSGKPGKKEHEIVFDGVKVAFPWGDDRSTIRQTLSQAQWLADWIESRTAIKTKVSPVLTFPGWYVRESPSPQLRVVNPKILPSVIRGRSKRTLSDEQIKLIALQLDLVCRDVED